MTQTLYVRAQARGFVAGVLVTLVVIRLWAWLAP